MASFAAGRLADALLDAEYVCRRFPMKRIPAILRARILHSAYPRLGARAWHAAWALDAENPLLQDLMLKSWLEEGGRRDVASLGPSFLPARCRADRHASLLPLLRAAGVVHTGACWKDGEAIEAMVFLGAVAGSAGAERAPRATLLLSNETDEYRVEVPGDGSRVRLAPPRPGAVWSLTLLSPDGRRRLLPGSPLAFYPPPAIAPTAAPAQDAAVCPRPVAIVVPVYRELALVRACLDSVRASLAHNRIPSRIVVVDDASPEPALSGWLDTLAAGGHITLLRNACNLGFIETVNRGMRALPSHDVLLLNADTQVHGDWIDRLAASLYGAPDVASVTPWTNNGEISSFPVMREAAPAPGARELALLDAGAARVRAAGGRDVELPSCCGFTMLIRREALDAIGMLDGSALVRGYGEEVDWCMRARAAGWRHLQATGVFVAHAGTVSFRAEKTLRVAQNRSVLLARYPGYYPEFAAFVRSDPLRAARAALREALAATPACDWREKAAGTPHNAALPDTVAATPLPAAPAALPSSCRRIGVWRLVAGTPAARAVLALARLIASAPGLGLRLLVSGDGSEALWRCGVADQLPAPDGDTPALLDDAQLLQAAGCRTVLAADPAGLPAGLDTVLLDAGFDAGAWLEDWIDRNEAALAA
ncbi:glycosyltransferase family 2 protein [Massilia sp. IC2-476]|uniref:glycosyltransferase family 2 protein n=1 Tax=Massilia sp. IC2-476 TaxID=2887199 RepID=UPI001D0FB5AF|nr:glycosyltransferase [Massilia sp. IC2-476]MCC2970846.1 glycosyltransferase [Massilia sp. IC2-476]